MSRSRSSVVVVPATAVVLGGVLFAAPTHAAADQPATTTASTQPATSTPADAMATMRRAFGDLADASADVRESARFTLMGMERRSLDDFRNLVEHSRPLRPAQAAALRQIVTHVYLSGEPYDPEPHAGFLGVRAQQIAISSADESTPTTTPGDGKPAPDQTGNAGGGGNAGRGGDPPLPHVGMVVISRLPGFVAHRVLQDGDVILGIPEQPDVTFTDPFAFTNAVKKMSAGDVFHLNVLRRGRVMKVELTLEHRPVIVENDFAARQFDHDRMDKADAYWRQSFAPLLPETLD